MNDNQNLLFLRRHSFLYLFYTPATRNMTLSENDTTNPSYFFPFEKINLVTTDLLHHQLLLWIPVLLSHICVLLLQLPLSWCPTSISGGIQNLNPKLGLYLFTYSLVESDLLRSSELRSYGHRLSFLIYTSDNSVKR